MIYPIYVYGSSVLRTESKIIDSDFPELGKLIDDMFETMYSSNGVGLAAPQIGKSIRLFVVDASVYADEEPALEGFKKAFINADIYERFGEDKVWGEGCLSLPGLNEDVIRPSKIKVRYLDENFVEHDCEFEGFAARVIQHEYDHIEQKLFIDHLTPLRKTLIKSKLNAMAKGKYKADYKTK